MKALGILAIIWFSVFSLVLLVLHIKSHKMIRSIFLNAILSFLAIAIINLTHKFTGVFIPLNWYSVGGSGIFGLPCVCGIILLQTLI